MQMNAGLVTSMNKQFNDSKIVSTLPEGKFALAQKHIASAYVGGCEMCNMHECHEKRDNKEMEKCILINNITKGHTLRDIYQNTSMELRPKFLHGYIGINLFK